MKVSKTSRMNDQGYTSDIDLQTYEEDMQPYVSLFMKPISLKKSEFSEHELARMCKDPMHSPELIRYLIEFFIEL